MSHKHFHIVANRSQPGFTLIELVMVILLLGIVGGMGANFIAEAFRGFSAAGNRVQMYEEGKIALVRMEREIHNAIPNAFNLPSATDIQFGMIDEEAMRSVFGQYTNNNAKKFINDRLSVLNIGTIVSIYNLSWANFTTAATPRLYEVTDNTHPSGLRMNLEGGARDIQANSPNKRFYAVSKAVRYCLDGSTLSRGTIPIDNTTYESGLAFPAACAGTGKPLASGISNLSFTYQPGTATNSPLVVVDFTITKNTESLNFHKEVMITNVP